MYNEEFVNIILQWVISFYVPSVALAYGRTTTVRRNFYLLHFFQQITEQQTSSNFNALMSLVERNADGRNFHRTVVRSYYGRNLDGLSLKKICGIAFISIRKNYSSTNFQKCKKLNTVFPRIVSALEQFPPLNSFRGQNLLKINSFLP